MIQTIFILHHTHVDLGYTDAPEKVFTDLVNMVDRVTDLVNGSVDRPEPERFRWIHEVAWPVFEYLRRGGARREELYRQVREGGVELTAMYVNPTDLFDRDSFEGSIDFACRLAKENRLPLTTAMFCDCPGIAWCVPDILAARGIRYLSAGPNVIMAPPLDVERPFYWQGPDGGRVLTWFSDWRYGSYGEGLDLMRLHEGIKEDPSLAVENVLAYVRRIEGEGYRWRGLALHLAQDNFPPRPAVMDFIARFHAAQDKITVRMATNRDFFEFMEQNHGSEFSVHKAAWPDWWANGHASAAYETACSRRTKAWLRRTRALAGLLNIQPDPSLLERAFEQMLLFDEHTWGCRNSAKESWSTMGRLQWTRKRHLALNALDIAQRVERQTAGAITAGSSRLVVANPFDTEWAGVVRVAGGEGMGRRAMTLKDIESQETIVGQRSRRGDESVNHYALRVPARTIRRFDSIQPRNAAAVPDGLENDLYRIDYDPNTGAIRQIHDKSTGRPLCDNKAQWTFGELVHERVLRGDRGDMFDPARYCSLDAMRPRPEFARMGGHQSNRRSRIVRGPVFNALETHGLLPHAAFHREIRLYHAFPRIDIILRLEKKIATTYESLYLALPFAAESPETWIENAGVVYRAGIDQLPGSATDWHSLGEYAAVTGGGQTVIVVPHDTPVVQIGDINTGKWQKRLDANTGHLYSWIMNNMWYTNFPCYQEGATEFTWSITTHGGSFDRRHAETFAHNARVGVVAKGS